MASKIKTDEAELFEKLLSKYRQDAIEAWRENSRDWSHSLRLQLINRMSVGLPDHPGVHHDHDLGYVFSSCLAQAVTVVIKEICWDQTPLWLLDAALADGQENKG